MIHKINEVMRRPHRYFYEDGLVEIAVGGLFLATGLLLQVMELTQSRFSLVIGLAIGLPLLVIGGTFLLRKAVQGFKERVTYPRTGHVSYRQGKPSQGRWLVAGVAFMLPVVLFFLPEQFSQLSLIEGALLCIIFSLMGYRVGLGRFYLLGAIAALIGLVAVFFSPGDIPGSVVTFGGTGSAMLISGVYALQRYLREHPAPGENE